MLDAAMFLQAMSRFASGVTVVTTGAGDQPQGLTVSSFSSLSLDPRLILVCIDLRARAHEALTTGSHFGVNILAAEQEHLSRHFAGPNKDDWSSLAITAGPAGAPLLAGALVQLECRLSQAIQAGDHTILIGEIEHAAVLDGEPLVYFRGNYRQLQAI